MDSDVIKIENILSCLHGLHSTTSLDLPLLDVLSPLALPPELATCVSWEDGRVGQEPDFYQTF